MISVPEELYSKRELRFRDGRFRILCVSDMHGVANLDKRLIRDFDAILASESPDLVLLLGDQVWQDAAEDESSLRAFLTAVDEPLSRRGIPWAHVFGNHDEERGFASERQQAVYESFPYCLSKRGGADVAGVSNYCLPVLGSGGEPAYLIWAMDTHRGFGDYIREFGLDPDPWFYKLSEPMHVNSGYDTVRFSQIRWYRDLSGACEKAYGRKIPGCMVFHIALPEYTVPYRNPAQTHYRGNMRETIGCGPVNSGLFNAIVERGDVKILVCGHDHINDWQADYQGVWLTYDGGLSYDGYCDEDLRGGRIIDIDENDPCRVVTRMVRSADVVDGYPGTEERADG